MSAKMKENQQNLVHHKMHVCGSKTQENPKNYGTEAAGVLDNFQPANFNANESAEYFGAFATIYYDLQSLSIQSVAASATVWL